MPLSHSIEPNFVVGKWEEIKGFQVGAEIRQGCVLFPLFIAYLNWIDKCSQADECATIGNCKISYLLFADH